jgi:hypothetical protein
MTEQTYLIALDAREPQADASRFRHALKNNGNIKDWWNYIPHVYLVKSDLNADELSADIWQRTKLRRFLVMQVNVAESEGMLPDEAWNWMRKREDELETSS